jgi:hypothetical protein
MQTDPTFSPKIPKRHPSTHREVHREYSKKSSRVVDHKVIICQQLNDTLMISHIKLLSPKRK